MHRRSRLASLFLVLAVTAASLGLLASNAVFAGGNPLPVATVNNATGLIGETVTLTVTFDNASTGTGDQTGYGPYIDLFLDTTGPDGAPSFDGLVTTGMRATYLGQPLPGMEVIPITGSTYVHPLTGQTLSVPGYGTRFQNGDTIVVLTLPFGSFTNTQPPAPINVSLRISNLADLGTPLPVTAVAGFRYGADPLDNPGADPPLRQTTPSDADVTPTLWTLTKTYLGPEDETATGRNYPRRYRLDVDIADGQPVTNLQITDVLANSMRITGNTAAQMSARLYNTPGVPTEVFNPANLSGAATPAAPGGTLIYSFGNKTGVQGIDASFEFEFYIPRDTSAATPTVPQGTDSTFANNTGSSSAAWTPIDTRDTPTPITITLPPNAHTLQQHSLATQKSVTPVDRNTLAPTTGGAIIPGSTLLRYDIDFQVSDYFAVQNVYLEDIISDGQRLFVRTSGITSTVPTLQVENAYVTGASPTRTTIAAAPFSGTGVITYQERFTTRSTPLSDPTSPPSGPVFTILTPAPSVSGTTYVRFDISQELIARGVSGRLVGGDIPNAGGAPQNNNPPLFGPTRGRITFYTEVKDEFSDDFPSGDRSVDQLDILRNTVPQIRGEQINTTTINNPTPTVIGQATDDTAASVELPIGDRSKTLYALNGQTTNLGDPVTVQPGDLVTYRLTYRLPISSFENVQFIDFPPLPVFPVPDRLFFDASAAPGTVPGANMVSRGPGDTYLTTVNPPTTVRVATTGNMTGYNPAGIGSFSGAPSMIDGVALANGDRVLVKDQTDARENGVYVVVNAASGAWDRATDFDTAREITNSPLVGVTAGATNAGQHFRQSNPTFNTFNTDAITWAPFITTDAAGNSFTFNFGWHDDVDGGRRESLIDLLVTLRVADAAFANDLFLTNQLRVNEFSTNAGSQYFDEIVMFEVIRPNVTINKGIVGYNTVGLTLGGVTFNPPDGSTAFGGTPVYTATQASAIGSSDSLLLSDAGDRVRYAIVLQNEGRGDAYDVTVTDTIPADYIRPATLAAANFAVRRGDGTLLTGDVVSGTVRAATTAPLTGATYATSPNNGQFTNAPRIIDGVTLNVGDRVLVKDQSVASQNGIYVVTSVFPGVNQATLTRADDFDNDAELTGGYRVAVLGGLSSNANRAFSTPGPITLNTTPITWTDAGVSDYYAVYNPLTGVFSVTLADNYTAGNTTAPTRDDRPGGLSRGASGPASNVVAVTNGSNTVIITYDVTLGDNVEPNQQIINTATLTHVATSDGGVDDQPDPFDTAQVTIRRPTIAKTLTATEIEDAANNRQQAVIGELITYTLTLTVPEGVMSNATLTDTLDAGLAFVDVTGVSASPALAFTGGGLPTVGATPANTTIGAGGQTITFNFGAITNSNRDNTVEETIVITYRAIVLNTSANQSSAQRNNRVEFSWVVSGQGSYALTPVEAANVTIIEPTLGVAKTLPSGMYDAGDLIDYTITFSHTVGSQGTAYDAVLTDTLPIDPFGSGSLILTPTVLSVTDSAGTLTTADFTLTGSNATSWTLSNPTPVDVAPGRVVMITVRGTLSNAAMPGAAITNTAFLRWASLDGTPGQRSTHNTASTERTGDDGPGGALNDYAGSDTATVTIVAPTLAKRIVATSEAHTADPLVLADFTNTGFDGLTGSWNTNVFTYPTFVRISGSATESGGGYITFASPVDLSNHTALALSARLVAGNGADTIDVHLQDADGTNWRWRFPASSFNFSTFTLVPQSLIGPNSTTIAAGTTPGLNLRNITRLEIRGDNGTAQFAIDIDAVIAFGNAAVPGEIVRYRLIATIPEGTSPNLQLHDRIPFGMRFINDDTVRVAFVSNSGVITSTSAGAQVPALSGAGLTITGNQESVIGLSLAVGSGNGLAIGEGTAFDGNVSDSNNVGTDTDTFNDGSDVYFRLGNVVNNDNDDDLEFVVVEFNAQVLNTFSDGNQSGRQLNNDFRYFRSGVQVGATSTQNDSNRITVVEPQINNLSKTISSAPPADAGDVFTYTLRFANGVAWPSSPAVPVRVATTGDIPGFNSTGGVGGTGQFTNAPATVNGVTLNVGDRILVRSQTNPAQNGVYTLVFIDPFTGARTWDRATDLDSTAELVIGYRVIVQEGSLAGRTYYLDEPLPSSINAGPILWREIDPALTVAVATTGNLGGGTFDATGGTLGRGTLSTTATVIDGVTVNATNFPVGTRILVKNQTNQSQNGIYRVTGFSGSTMNLERVAEFDSRPEAIDGTQVYVTGGTINAGRTFAVSGAPSGTPITTSLTFALVDQVTAFDVTVYDQLPPTLELLGVQIDAPTGTTATNGSTLGVGGVISYTLDRLDSVQDITSGRTDVVVTATVRVVAGTVAGAQITNTARVQYTSLPGERGTTANPTGSSVAAGTAGTQNGERTGGDVPNPINNSSPSNNTIRNNYSVGAIALTRLTQPSFDKQFQGGSISDDDTSVAGTSGISVTVGEAVLYDLLVTLPEGTTNSLRVVDAVPDGMRFDPSFNSVGYQIVTSAGGLLTQNFSNPSAVASPTLTVSGTGTLGDDGVDALFNFGDVTVTDDNNPNNNAFIIRVRLIVTNTTANQSGATRANGGALRYNDGYSGADVTLRDPTEPQVTIVEPTPLVRKEVSGAAADAGDSITYTIRLENSAPRSEMTAYDVVISDTIAPELINPTIVAVSATGAPVSIADFEIVTVGPDRILRTTAPITLPLGSTVIITFTGELTSAVTTDQIITNRASMFWSSTPGANPDERNGNGVPNPPECSLTTCDLDGGQLNNYGLISSVTTTAIAPVVVSKSVIEGVAPSTSGTNVTIGEIVTYRLAVSLPEGVTSGLVITDTLPAGMAYLPGSATLVTGTLATGDPALSGGHPAGAGTLAFNGVFSDTTDPAVTPIGDPQFLNGTDVRFTFDQITLPGDNDTRNNTFFIRYQAVVLDVPGNTGLTGSQTTLTNSGQFDVPSTPQPPVDLLIDPNGATVTVVEPELAILKSVTPTVGDAGDPVTYTITLSHTARSLADAFDVAITDALPATIGSSLTETMTLANVTATHSTLGDITGNFSVTSNTLTTTMPFTLPLNATVTVTITGVLRQSVQPGETITNTVALTSTSLPGLNQDLSPDTTGVSDGTDRERSRSASSSVTLSTGQGAFSKELSATSAPHTSGADITIGEIISYTLIVDLPEGTIRNLVLTDDLPAGLDYEGFTVITDVAQSGGLLTQDFAGTVPSITVTGGAGSGDDVTLTFSSDVVVTGDNNAANNRFLVVVRVRALDESGMVGLIPPGRTTLTNTATMRYTDGSNITRTFTDTETVRVVEPQLTITKNIVQAVANAGDPITITLTVTNTGTSDAFDIVITDTLPPDFDAATTTFGAAGSDYPAMFTPSRTGSEVRYEGGPIPAGATVTFTFRVNLTGTVTPGATITNTARMARSTSLPGDDPTERVQTPVDSSDTMTIRSNSLSGFVYVDADNDGAFDSGETPIQGVTITLTGTDHLGNVVNLTATTSITGYYRFDNLRPGTYTLAETQPAGYLDGRDTIGTQGGAGGNDVFSITLPIGVETNGENNNFGELLAARIAGFVYEDNNNNGNFETGLGESSISGVTITLSGTDDLGNSVLLTTTTTVTGFYAFDDLRPGTYTVIETQPTGYLDGRDTAGAPGGGTTTVNDRIANITLTPGMASLNNNFGELRLASLSGRVYYDVNNNGADNSEPGIGGVTITLTGTDDLGNPVTLTTTTDASGVYTFTNLRPGTYTVIETQPSGYFDGAESVGSAGGSVSSNDVIGNVTLSAGVAATGYNFGELLAARIAGFVYEDDDNDGVFDTTENGISGVTITLTGTDDLGNGVLLTTTTTVTGFYAFDDLRPGTYAVIETQPTGYFDGRDTAGTLGGDTTVNDRIASITLPSGVASLNNNFGELRPASLSGRVYRDDNNDGIPDAGEPGIGGVTITLTGTDDLSNTVTLTATTTVTGYYRFDNLRPGTYMVSETQPIAYNDGTDRSGTAGGVLSNDQVSTIIVPGAGIDAVNYDFGERGTFVSGIVWIDTDRDETLDGGENGRLGSVTVTLSGTDLLGNSVLLTTTTTITGFYIFDNLPAGNYVIEQTQPTGYGSSTPNTLSVTVPLTGLTDQNFGETVSTLSGYVYVDSNNNGVFDAGESGIGGVPVTLTGTDVNGVSVTLTTLTLADGSYRFENLLAGTYTISETQPLIYSDGLESIGTIDGTPVGMLVSNDVIGNITLSAGTDGINYNFGELADAGLGDRVWLDRNGDGAQDPGEPGIGGVQVYLDLNNDGVLDAGEPVTTTNALGQYFFGNLPGGTYTVRVDTTTLPGGVSQTYDLDGATVTPHAATASLAAGATRTDVDFGYRGTASIGDRVWLDRNGDGVQDAGEPGIGGVTVYLDLDNDGARDADEPFAVTDATGNYLIDGLPAGTYTVRVVTTTLPTGINQTYDLDGVGTPGVVTGVTLTSGEARTNVDFGYRGTASIGDRVWNDANANGIQDAGETGVDGVVVALYDSTGALLITTTTDLNGNYLFDNLPAGTYTVGVGATPGRSISPRGAGSDPALDSDIDRATRRSGPITLTAGEARTDIDIGLYQLAAVGSQVWLDRDLDGIREADESGIGGIEVRLLRSDGTVVATQTTDANGSFMFTDVEPGEYRIAFSVPSGYYVSPFRQGNDRGADSDADPATGLTPIFTLTPGQIDPTWFMGLSPISPTAIQLTRFSAERGAQGIVVRWETAAEYGTRGFYLERSATGSRSDAVRITDRLIPAKGSVSSGASYEWNDATAAPGTRYTYWLIEETTDGATHIYGPATLEATTGGGYTVMLPLIVR
jgi:fimbrial isopeptide formation D2 family protein/uncharacterized repeat protein (TIGR01451 family)